MRRGGLGRALEELERADPNARRAAENYDTVMRQLLGKTCRKCLGTGAIVTQEGTARCPCENDHNTVTFETDGPKDGLGRYHFAIRWWDDGFHMGPQWRGQHFHDRIEPHIGKAKADGKAVVVRPRRRA